MADTMPVTSDVSADSTSQTDLQSKDSSNPQGERPMTEMSDIERIKAAHAARRSRRSRPPRPPSTSVIPPPSPQADTESDASVSQESVPTVENSNEEGSMNVMQKKHDEEIKSLNYEISNMRVELSSLRRNHLQNIKKLTEERDMFAAELAKEQDTSKSIVPDSRKLVDVEAQLRASRTRNSDLEAENKALREEVKQLAFRVQASKTLDAATNGYEKVVDELVDAKLKCAQLQEEKEDLLRINKELMTTSAVLRDANGELEKSRSEWVLQCAEVEKKRAELESRLKDGISNANDSIIDPSYSGSDLQELKL